MNSQVGKTMTKDQVVEAAGLAVLNLNEQQLKLNFAGRTSRTGNVWRISYRHGCREAEINVYLFPDTTPEEAVELFQERLSKSLKQISS
jgi:hypothetical protein